MIVEAFKEALELGLEKPGQVVVRTNWLSWFFLSEDYVCVARARLTLVASTSWSIRSHIIYFSSCFVRRCPHSPTPKFCVYPKKVADYLFTAHGPGLRLRLANWRRKGRLSST